MNLDRKSETMNDIKRVAINMQANGIGRNAVLAIIWIATMIWLGTVQAWSQTLPTFLRPIRS